jgi:hypothetical protein
MMAEEEVALGIGEIISSNRHHASKCPRRRSVVKLICIRKEPHSHHQKELELRKRRTLQKFYDVIGKPQAQYQNALEMAEKEVLLGIGQVSASYSSPESPVLYLLGAPARKSRSTSNAAPDCTAPPLRRAVKKLWPNHIKLPHRYVMRSRKVVAACRLNTPSLHKAVYTKW